MRSFKVIYRCNLKQPYN